MKISKCDGHEQSAALRSLYTELSDRDRKVLGRYTGYYSRPVDSTVRFEGSGKKPGTNENNNDICS